MGHSIKDINAETAKWVEALDGHREEIKRLEAQRAKLAPNGAAKFKDLEVVNRIDTDLKRQYAKVDAAEREIRRLYEASDAAVRQIDRLKRSRETYERQLQPHGIDWSRVDPSVDRAAHLDELREKIKRIDKELAVMYGN